jgi:hypothetical protein
MIYLSHSSGRRDDPDWFIVEPRDDPHRLAAQIHSLLWANRRVLEIEMHPQDDEGRVVEIGLVDVPWPELPRERDWCERCKNDPAGQRWLCPDRPHPEVSA